MDTLPLFPGLLTPQEEDLRLNAYFHLKRKIAVLNSDDCLLYRKRLADRHIRDVLDRLGGMAGEW